MRKILLLKSSKHSICSTSSVKKWQTSPPTCIFYKSTWVDWGRTSANMHKLHYLWYDVGHSLNQEVKGRAWMKSAIFLNNWAMTTSMTSFRRWLKYFRLHWVISKIISMLRCIPNARKPYRIQWKYLIFNKEIMWLRRNLPRRKCGSGRTLEIVKNIIG